MFTKKMIFRLFIIIVAFLFISGTASASGLAAPIGTSFTYQGRLTDGGAPANGSYDFNFKLFDAITDGIQVGSDFPLEDVVVSGGLFTVQLDFGNVFDGRVLYLEIGVRPAGGTSYTTLTPRQALSPTPYAFYAVQADGASRLEGQPGSYYLNASNITAGTLANSFFDAYSNLLANHYLDNLAGNLARNNGTLQPTLNADLLDGLHSSSFLTTSSPLNASNINSGTLGNSFFDAYANLLANHYLDNLAGNLARNNGTLQPTLNADRLDGLEASSFAPITHNHWGGTWTGSGTGLTLSGGSTGLSGSGSTYGVSGNATGPAGYGLYGTGFTAVYGNSSASSGTGVYGETSGPNSTGVYGHSTGAGTSYGVYGNGPTGVYGFSNTTGGYGIYGKAISGAGTNYAGYFDGNVQINGNLNVTGTTNFNADQLDGQHGTYYLNATNINAGSLDPARYSAYSDLVAEGYLGNAAGDLAFNNGTQQATLNADLLDGSHAGSFSLANHDHWGATWSGTSGTGLLLSGGYIGLSGSGSSYGVYGASTNGNGIYGTSTNSYGVYGTSSTTTAIYGNGLVGVYGIGTLYGVSGQSSTAGQPGIYGRATNGTGTDFAGLFDGNVQVNGSLGITSTALVTNLNADQLDGLHASSFASVDHNHWGATWTGSGTGLTLSGGTIGLSGSGSTTGVSGTAGFAGVLGTGLGSGYGVLGQGGGANSTGVYGYADYNGGTGVMGYGQTGVYGVSTTSGGKAIYGSASGGAGNDYAGFFDGNVNVNGTLFVTGNTNINADRLDGYHAANLTGNVPISNGTLNTNLNADMLDGLHASSFASSSHNHWGETWTGSGTGLTLSGGTIGLNGSGSTFGVQGSSSSGNGVLGTSSTGTGVYGSGNTYGVWGTGNTGIGGSGSGSANIGVAGDGNTGVQGVSTIIGGKAIYGGAFGGAGTNYAGYFDGNVQVNGSLGITSSTLVTNLNADLLDGKQASAFAPDAKNVVIVAKSGGDFTTITAALNSITDASDANRYLIYVAPGVYTEQVMMKQYVDIEGAGELTTKITFTGSSNDNNGTLWGANNAELRFLTVENTGGSTAAIAIYNNNASPRLTRVTARASGSAYNEGVTNKSSSPAMTDVTAIASGAATGNYGVYNSQSSPTLTGVNLSATGGTTNVGMHDYQSSPTINNSNIRSSGGSNNYGIYNNGTGSYTVLVNNSQIGASGGANNYGVYSNDTTGSYTVLVNNSQISGSGGTINCGIYTNVSSGPYTVQVNNSQISGSTNTIANDSHSITLVGASQLNGGAATAGGGTLTCAGVYDENYAFYASTCP